MSTLLIDCVREYFEHFGFWIHRIETSFKETEAFVVQKESVQKKPFPSGFQIFSGDLDAIDSALIISQGWSFKHFNPQWIHSAGMLNTLLKKLSIRLPSCLLQLQAHPQCPPNKLKFLIIPYLPTKHKMRDVCLSTLQALPIDGVISFSTLLEGLIRNIDLAKDYKHSSCLQTLKMLKLYERINPQQLELFKP